MSSKKDLRKAENKSHVFEELEKMVKAQTESKMRLAAKLSSRLTSSTMFDEDVIRREKRRRLETKKEITKMRAELPEYDLNDIRFFKLPYHEALMLMLEENGCDASLGYLEQLFEHDERLHKEAGPQSFIWNCPYLKHSDNELKKLSDALVEAEKENKSGNHRKESEILLKVAIDFAFNYNTWYWLAEELIIQCISISRKSGVTGRHEATSRFIYAKLLIDRAKEYDSAERELNIVRDLSKGKSWNVKGFNIRQSGSDKSDTLYMNANYLLHLCYIRTARSYQKTDLLKALEFATLAKKRAGQACYYNGETMALFIKGQCELNLGNTKEACNTFNKAYYIQSKLNSEKGICETRVELSKAYLMHGNTRLALKTLMDLKTMAEEHGLQYYLAQAYRYLGEYYLTCGEPHKATPLLSDALEIFHSIGNMAEADQVRNLGALSSGLELMFLYIPLVQRTDKRCSDYFNNLMMLVKWKDTREPFWMDLCNNNAKKAGLLSEIEWDEYCNQRISLVGTSTQNNAVGELVKPDVNSELFSIIEIKASSFKKPSLVEPGVEESEELIPNEVYDAAETETKTISYCDF
ncbi:uncharacterized protein LOC126741101 [Anthonomus grandis grandis]|uniref:uncharacterized protein LOC126741101 n=1 Tax=Anthonomus grandis grandis TaxID=2921223 RepID=UPI0021661822|nr:uncharacterized protein LOC126741101 [Anthonomus grandis grandis]